MNFTWTETHTAEISDERLKEIFEDGKTYPFGGKMGLLAENLCDIMYDTDRCNIYEYVNEWDDIIQRLYRHGEEISKGA